MPKILFISSFDMKKFISKIAIYCIIISFGIIILDVIITKGLQHVDDFIYQPWQDMKSSNLSHDVLILGNSRAQGHIHPAILDSIIGCDSYNLGIEAYPLNIHIFKYNYYIAHDNSKPKVLIYQVDMRTFVSANIKRGSNSEQFLTLFYESICREEFSKRGYNLFDLYCPLYRYFGYHTAIRQGILEGLGITHFIVNPAYKGFKGWNRYMSETEIESMGNQRFEITSENRHLFENFISQCKLDGINIVLVYSPIYEKSASQLTDNHLFRDTMKEISEHLGVVFLDYTLNKELCSRIDYYSSPNHLNIKGAEAFSLQLAHDLDSILTLKN